MNAKTIEGLKAIRNGIDLILSSEDVSTAEEFEQMTMDETVEPVKKTRKTKKTEDVSASVETEASNEGITREKLDSMTYNNIKKYAKEHGFSAVGNRDEITARILGESAPAPVAPEVEEDDTPVDPLYDRVVSSVADMSNEEIADLLVEVGVSAKGKREALLDKLVQAVRDGLLDFDDEDSEDGEEDEESDEKTASVADDEESEDEEEDTINDTDNPDMTEARKDAILAQDAEIRQQFKSKELKKKDMIEFLQSFYDTEEDMKDLTTDELLDTYIDAVCRLIDDDGELVEEGAYMLNGEPACCGRHLSYSEDTNKFICEHCGEEYDAEE